MKRVLPAAVFFLLGVSLLSHAASPNGWPQWRGQNRNGEVSSGPKLLDSWAKEGPKLLWKSAPLPPYERGGAGSPVVSGGRIYLYFDWVHFTPQKLSALIGDTYLLSWGWAPNMPEELVKKLEAARLSEERKKTGAGPALDAYIRKFVGTLSTDQQKKFGKAVENRLKRGGNAWNWTTLTKLGTNLQKEIKTADAFRELMKDTNIHHNQPLEDDLSKTLLKAQRYADTIVCLDAATGKEIWKKEFPGTYAGMWGGAFAACGTPAVSGGRCYATGSAGLYCLNVKDGSLVWKVGTRYSNSSPLVADGTVFVLANVSDKPISQMGGSLTAYAADTGKVLWTQGKIYSGWGSSPVLWQSGGKSYIISNSDGKVFCLNPKDGKIIWEAPGGGSSSPAISGDIMVMDNGGKKRAYKLTPEKAELLWEKPGHGDRMGSPVIYKGYAFFDSAYQGGTTCLDLKTGEQKWHQKNAGHCSSLTLADGKIFANTDAECDKPRNGAGNLWAFKAIPDKFDEVGRFCAQLIWCATPTVADGRLYIRQMDGVGCYDLTK